MANIGFFTKTRSGYEGTITTLTLCAPASFVPNRKKKNETSPDYFIKGNGSDLGVAWKADPGEGAKDSTPYLKCVLDDPSFSAPVQAALFDHANGADLVWSRRSEP
ncbi:MAG TPA: DUF736 domain-containing protein [Hyphomonas sp.]|jgi:uncharacterized protein (DUF736 family)|uniref:DUF736 domain-containing protein n=1 Tax=uncultured Hyphomonas sp. TaxID=225298 RepID=UPI000C3B50EB|nr:hypothetical protein [Hyphomonas sp.]MAN91724.1 hypothetical protein [Hyphomonadaceae bacterium]HBL93059.1 DUF736 domain-containing protein [Hyphomonas sp.]HCJ18890.1 DUF736 domain-containing protein [Hyphomonas sp.]|tara:strand:- start:6945 stop:7262 length:318 start_codon:yes stop_codon:yes gene_type:complete